MKPQLFSSVSFDGGAALLTPTMIENLDTCSNDTKIQQHALATLCCSANGNGWCSKAGQLSDDSERRWRNSLCKSGSVVGLNLWGDNLVGTTPNELALLSDSLGKACMALIVVAFQACSSALLVISALQLNCLCPSSDTTTLNQQ